MAVQTVAGGQALDWFREGWELFRREALNCVIVTIAWFVITALLGLVPVVGGLLVTLLTPALYAGLVACARASDLGYPVGLDTFLSPLTVWRLRRPMLVLGGLLIAASFALVVAAFLFGGTALAGSLMAVASGQVAVAGGVSLLPLLVVLAGATALGMAFLYAPVAIFLDDTVDPIAALRASFRACVANMLPMAIAGAVLIPLTLVALLPAGLGLVILLPVTAGAVWSSYKGIFGPAAPAPAAT